MHSTLLTRLVHLVRSQFLGMIALALVLTGGAAYAAAAKNSVTSKSIKDGQVKTVDIAAKAVTGPKIAPGAVGADQLAPNSVTSAKVADGSLTGTDIADESLVGGDIDEASLDTVPVAANAAALGGVSPSGYLRSQVYKREATTDAGTALGDGTFTKFQACDPGDILLAGGPANLLATSDLVESFPTPGATNSWSARIQKNGTSDTWTVVILCLNQV